MSSDDKDYLYNHEFVLCNRTVTLHYHPTSPNYHEFGPGRQIGCNSAK